MLRKKIWLSIFLIFIVAGCAKKVNQSDLYNSILKRDKLIVGISFDSKPFGFLDSNGQVKGLEADLAREIADRLLGDENKVEFKNVTSQDRIKVATNDEVDMVISTMTINSQRKKVVDFSSPYFIAGQVICVKKQSKINSLDDLLNKRVIVVLGTTGEKNIKSFAPNALIQGYINNSDAIDAFKTGNDDAITTDDSLLLGLVQEDGKYHLLPKRLTKEPYGIAFKKSRHTKTFKESVDKIIDDMKEDGTLENIKGKWITN